MSRRNLDYDLNLVVGRRGSGKTTFLKGVVKFELETLIPVIVFDPTGHAWSEFEECIKIKDVKRNIKEKKPFRISTLLFMREEEIVKKIMYARNVVTIFDDADVWIFKQNKKIYNVFFYANRHIKQHVYVVCHSFNNVPRAVIEGADYFIVFSHTSYDDEFFAFSDVKGELYEPLIYPGEVFRRIYAKK